MFREFELQSMLTAERLSFATPDGRPLQENLSFDVQSGQLFLISGSNGCGKSTLLRILMGERIAEKGHATWSVAREKITYIPQLENTEIHLPVTLRDVLEMTPGRRPRESEYMRFGLLRKDLLPLAWNTASGGERKRTLLARALLTDPSVLVFDEPMNHLDVASRRIMIRVMKEFLDAATPENPRAIVMVCHQGLPDEEDALFRAVRLGLLSKEEQ